MELRIRPLISALAGLFEGQLKACWNDNSNQDLTANTSVQPGILLTRATLKEKQQGNMIRADGGTSDVTLGDVIFHSNIFGL